MKRKFLIILTLILVIPWIFLNANISILDQNSSSLTLKIEFSDYALKIGEDFSTISFENWGRTETPGAPDLPVRSVKIIIPENGELIFKVLSIDTVTEYMSKPLKPVPDIFEFNETYRYDYRMDEELYRNEFQEFYTQKVPEHFRYYDYIPLIFKPVILEDDRKISICRSLILEISIEGDRSTRPFIGDQFEELYSDFFINYEQGRLWQRKIVRNIAKLPFERSDFWYNFEIERGGVFRITEQDLSVLPDFYDPASLRLFTMNRTLSLDNSKEYDLQIVEIPLTLDMETGDVYFNISMDGPDLPKFSSTDHIWLTFGGNFDNDPLRSLVELDRNIADEISNFTEYIKNYDQTRNRSVNSLYIYPQEYLSQTQTLAQFHNDFYGLGTEIVEQQWIFDQYSSGDADPIAIKNYINDYWQSLSEEDSLKYVILVGSGTHDWLDQTEKNRIMTLGDSDDNFVTFTANVAELIISRFPAQNADDLDVMIERIQNYTEDPLPGWWRNSMVLLADDEHKDGDVEGFTSNSGLNHTNLAQIAQNAMNEGFFVDKVLGIEYNFDEYNNKPDARNTVIEKVNNGCLIWYFIGHGNPDVLGDEDYFRGSQHLRLLDNDILPLFLAASCSVGEFDSPAFDCIAEKLLFLENGGSIASIAASRECSGTANTAILKEFLKKIVNERLSLGDALFHAKTTTTYVSTAKKYNLLGDPVMYVVPPLGTGEIFNIPDSIRAREMVTINADLDLGSPFSGEGTLRVFDSEYEVYYTNTLNEHTYEVTYSRNGSTYYRGGVEVITDEFHSTFIVPDDIRFGDEGKVINYLFDESLNQDYVTYAAEIVYSSVPGDAESNDSPQVDLWLDSRSFLSGDYVSSSPLMIAEIADSNGINILGSAGHKILLLLDDDHDPIDVTEQFNYYTGSSTEGLLQWQINDLQEGFHYLTLIVFDNFNNPTVTETEFRVRQSGKVSIEQMLVYPNPVKKDGHFTFVLTEDSDITIAIYTITGRKIRTIKKQFCEAGFNQIYWDGKDGDGDYIANNTYFYKIKAKQLGNREVTEKIGKLIILK